MKFSIIVPVYNTEKYLRSCLDSILAQDSDNYQVILVVDGSPDNSIAICNEYAQKYSFFQVISKPNGGVSSARNAGVKVAQGEYIYFLDSDDIMEPKVLNTIDQFLAADCYFSTYEKTFNFASQKCTCYKKIPDSIKALTLKDMLYTIRTLHGSVCFAIYSKKLIKDIPFNETIAISEDTLWLDKVLDTIKDIKFVDIPYVTYNLFRMGSATTVPNMDKLYSGIIAQKELVEKYIKKPDAIIVLRQNVQLLWHIIRQIYTFKDYRRHAAYKLSKELRYTLKISHAKIDKLQRRLTMFLGFDNAIRLVNHLIGRKQ